MKKLLLFIAVFAFAIQAFAFIPANFYENNTTFKQITLREFLALTPQKYQELTGNKLTFKEKFFFKILKLKLKKNFPDHKTQKKNNFGTLSILFGIIAVISIAGLSIPIVGLLSLFSAIAALIFGIMGLRRNKRDTASLIGLILGGVYLLLAIIFIAVIINFGYK